MAEDARGSPLYSYIDELQGDLPYGSVLDAGTGPRSLGWLMTRDSESWTAVTGAGVMKARLNKFIGQRQRPQDRLLVGNWANPDLLKGEQFDTVLADHLLGAIEVFAPYFQTALFPRLRPLTGKRLYVTGMEPYVVQRPADEAGALIWEIGRYRDACLILSGKLAYREFPLRWVVSELRRAGFRPIASRKFPTGYKAHFVNAQIDFCREGVEGLADQALAQALLAHGDALRARALDYIERSGSLSPAWHYVVAAEPA